MKKLLTTIGAAMIGFAATVNAEEINLRDWLTAKGVTVSGCVTGVGHLSGFGPERLFDGDGKGTSNPSNYRWLAMEKANSTASATIEIPKSVLSTAKKELVLKKVCLWRNINGDTGIQRAPTTWVIYGSNDDAVWTEIQRQSVAVSWSSTKTSHEILLPNNTKSYRFLKFQPLTSTYNTTYAWLVGLQEIEYFVEEVPQKPGVNLREWLTEKGVTVADCVSGEGYHTSYGPTILFDGTNSVSNATDAESNRWLAKKNAGDTAYATISAPDELFASDADGLVLRRYRIYRNSDLSDAHYLRRAPATWRVLGYDSKKDTWEVIDDRSSVAADWLEPGIGKKAYVEFEVPAAGRTPYRKFMFEPLESGEEFHETTAYLEWRIGAMEIEYFVEEAQAVNLRTYLAAKGVTVAECVSGTGYHNSYKPEKLFDGEGMNNDKVATERWLAGENDITTVSATIEMPSSALPVGKKGLAVKKIRLWRCIDIYNTNDGLYRAPQTWVFYGSNTGNDGDWTEIQRQSEPVAWNNGMLSFDVALPDNDTPFRFLKFLPLSSKYTDGTYKVGLRELEYFVAEVEPDTVVVCGSLGDDVGGSSHDGYGRVNGVSAGDTVTITAKTPSYANGVKYEATGYTLETSADGGITWGAATSHNGTSATIAYNGTPTRLIWQWSPVAYRLDVHADEGNETVTVSPASADGYYAAGTALTVTAAGATSPTVTTFKEWDVQPEGAVADGATISFTMPATPTEVNAAFTRPWTYIAQGNISNYPDYKDYAAVTDGNWLFVVASRKSNAVSAEQYFCINAYVEGSGRLDLTTLYSDLETQGTRLYPLRGVNDSAMYKKPDLYASWNDGRGKVTSVVVPDDILDVEGAAFGSCPNLVSATLEGNLEKWNILNSGTAGAFNDCSALTNATFNGATALPHHIFSGSAPEVVFDGVPPTTIGTGWADDWSLAVGCPRSSLGEWRADSRFTALAAIEDVASKPNYAAMVERYGNDLVGAWDGKWLFRYGNPLGLVIIFK